ADVREDGDGVRTDVAGDEEEEPRDDEREEDEETAAHERRMTRRSALAAAHEYEIPLHVIPEHEILRADFLESPPLVKLSGARVVLPHREPHLRSSFARRLIERGLHERGADSAADPLRRHVQTIDL